MDPVDGGAMVRLAQLSQLYRLWGELFQCLHKQSAWGTSFLVHRKRGDIDCEGTDGLSELADKCTRDAMIDAIVA